MKKVAVITDNNSILQKFKSVLKKKSLQDVQFTYYCSPGNSHLFQHTIPEITIKNEYWTLQSVDLIISLHCQQIFPKELIEKVRCVNIHPGLNPYNRGWYPHIFCVMNGLPAGATIHEIDEHIDHGLIIASQEVPVEIDDTSKSLYEKIHNAEMNLVEKHIVSIIKNTYEGTAMDGKGNYNSKKDFHNSCQLDLDKEGTFKDFYNTLRALSFEGYDNAFFYDENGNKVFLHLQIKKE